MTPIDAPLLKDLNFAAIEFVPMDHPMYYFEGGDQGEQSLFRLSNGLYISIVRHKMSYGGDRGQYEIMTMTAESDTTGVEVKGITDSDGIIGYLEPRDVTDVLVKLSGVSL